LNYQLAPDFDTDKTLNNFRSTFQKVANLAPVPMVCEACSSALRLGIFNQSRPFLCPSQSLSPSAVGSWPPNYSPHLNTKLLFSTDQKLAFYCNCGRSLDRFWSITASFIVINPLHMYADYYYRHHHHHSSHSFSAVVRMICNFAISGYSITLHNKLMMLLRCHKLCC